MKFSEELQSKIKEIFANNEEIRDKLLAGDTDAIRQIAAFSQRGINPEELVEAYESNDADAMKRLYSKAKRMFELQKLYEELCLEYSEKMESKSSIDRG